jgi:hypothetical protein
MRDIVRLLVRSRAVVRAFRVAAGEPELLED